MPTIGSTPRRDLDVAFHALTAAQDDFFAAADRITAYQQSPAQRGDGSDLPVPMRFRIRHSTTAKRLREAAVVYRAAQQAYATAYPQHAARLFGYAA